MTAPFQVSGRADAAQHESRRAELLAERDAHRAAVAEYQRALDALPSDDLEQRDLVDALLARARNAVVDATRALERMDEGTYGMCETCGATIPPSDSRPSPRR